MDKVKIPLLVKRLKFETLLLLCFSGITFALLTIRQMKLISTLKFNIETENESKRTIV